MRPFVIWSLILAALLPSAVLFWMARDAPHLGYFQDDSLYLASAKSIAEGNGYKIASLPGQPYQTKYPPLFSLILALIWKLDSSFPENLSKVMLFQWLLWLLYLAAVSLVVWKMPVLQISTRVAVMLFVATAPAFVYLSLSIMPETLFAAFALLTIWLVGLDCRPKTWFAFLAGLCASIAFLAKTAALPLLVAVPLALIWRKRPRAAILFAVPPLVTVSIWTAWVLTHRYPTTDLNLLYYTDYIGFHLKTVSIRDLPLLFTANLSALVENTGRLILFFPPAGASTKVLHIVLGLLVLLSTASLLRKLRAPALTLFAALYTAQCLLWNFPPHERFFFPFLFLLVAGFFDSLNGLLGRVMPVKLGAGPWFACTAVLIAWSLLQTWSYLTDFLPEMRRGRDRLVCASQWVDTNIPSGRRFLAYRDVDLFLYSGRLGIRMVRLPLPYYRIDRAEVEKALSRMPAYAHSAGLSYLLWDRLDYLDDPYLGDNRTRERILSSLSGVVLERELCGMRIYRFSQP
jgi:hypothetical protein